MRMRWAYLVAALLASIAMHAQTTVSGQTTDSDGIHWAGGQWTATYTNIGYDPPVANSQPFTQSFSGTLDANGSFSQALTSTNLISPSVSAPKAGWSFCVSPGISNPQTYCTAPQPVTGTTLSVSAAIDAVMVAPRPTCGAPVFAYADVEMSLPVLGCTYYNTTIPGMRVYTLGGWTNFTGGGGSTSPGGSGYSVQYNNAGSFGGALLTSVGCFSATAAPANCTSAQMVAALNNSPTTLLSASLIPTLPYLTPANNLSDVSSVTAARTNLGLGTAATTAASAYDAAGSAATAQAASLQKANNLNDLASATTARTNLGLGTIATQNTSAVALTGGSINGVVIGGTTPAAGTFTTVNGLTTTNFVQVTNSKLCNVTTVTASATPALVASNCFQAITLNSNATPTISGIAAGQRVAFQICQPASGGPYTWTWPAAVHGGITIGTTASTCSEQAFDSYSGTTLVSENTGVINVAP